MSVVILHPLEISEWAEVAIKQHAFYTGVGCDDLEAMRLTATDVRDAFERSRLRLCWSESDESVDDAYQRGLRDGKLAERDA